ncbi:MAG TPA: hypothetical protein VF179_31245 [Thermoanaerobaculia bacterium]|nr:hypothetical protein [Thermoanaerobaculia bacterium]
MKTRAAVLAVFALVLLAHRGEAERIVAGVVEKADSYWKGNLIHTDYVLRAGDERIAFTLPGGTIGDETHGTSWSLPLEKGGRYLLFLGDEGSPPIAVPETAEGMRSARNFYVIRNPAVPPIAVNPVPSSFSQAGRDMAAYWNVYAPGLFQIESPSASWSFGNGVSDIAGLVDDAKLQAEFGESWFPGALSWVSWRLRDGHIVETDIALNPAFSWTLDEDKATRLGGPQSFRHAVLAGLGIAWGLAPSFSLGRRDRESVLGIASQPYKLAILFSDDTAAVRSAFGGARTRDGLISAYSLQPAPGALRNVAVGTVPVPGSTAPGSYFLAFRLRAPGDRYAPNDFAWSDSTVALTVKAR